MADLGNQLMLAFGLQRSMRAADTAHPYGYGFEQYVWAMVRGLSTFAMSTAPRTAPYTAPCAAPCAAACAAPCAAPCAAGR